MLDSSLPIYPNEVRGSIRHVLILKDFLMLTTRLLERLCRFGSLAGRQLSREFILAEIVTGNEDIEDLKINLESRKVINDQLKSKLLEMRKELGNRSHLFFRPKDAVMESVCQRLKNKIINFNVNERDCINIYYNENETEPILPDPFDCVKVKTVLEFLKDLFLIQLHFHIVLVQGLNFSLPLLINDMNFIDRLFFWPDRPEYGMVAKKVNMADKLRDIQVELQKLVEELVSVSLVVEAKFHYDQKLEYYYHYTLARQCAIKRELLNEINFEKEIYDVNQLEHSRIVGSVVKIDPGFSNNPNILNYYLDYQRPLTPRRLPKIRVGDKSKKNHTKDAAGQVVRSSLKAKNTDAANINGNVYENLINKDANQIDLKHENAYVEFSRKRSSLKPPSEIAKQEDFTKTTTDSKVQDLIDLSENFSFNIKNNSSKFQEPKRKETLQKIQNIVENIIENDRIQLIDLENKNCSY